MLKSKPSSLEQEDDDFKGVNIEQTIVSPNNNELVPSITKTEAAIATNATTEIHKDLASSTAKDQHRNSGSRDSNGSKTVDTYIRTSKGSNHSSNNGGGGGGDNASDDEEETDIIGELVGHFGKWQFLMTILLSLFQVPNTFHISSSVYQVRYKHLDLDFQALLYLLLSFRSVLGSQ